MKLRTGALACGAALGLTGVVALGTGTAFAAPYVNNPTLTVSDPNPFPGMNDGVHGFNYVPNEIVSIDGHSVPVHFANVTADAAGAFTLTITIPTDWACSRHTIVGTGATGDTASAELFVQGCGGGNGGGDHHHHHHRFHHEHGGFGGGGDYCDDDGSDDGGDYSDSDDTDSCYVPDEADHRGPGYDDDGPLPSTGAKVAGLGAVGAALIGGGLVLTVRRKRRSAN